MHFAKEKLLSRERLFLPFARVGFSFGGTFSPRTLLIVDSSRCCLVGRSFSAEQSENFHLHSRRLRLFSASRERAIYLRLYALITDASPFITAINMIRPNWPRFLRANPNACTNDERLPSWKTRTFTFGFSSIKFSPRSWQSQKWTIFAWTLVDDAESGKLARCLPHGTNLH